MLDLQRPDPQRLRGETRGERQRHLLRQQREIANQHADREQRGEKCDLEQAGVTQDRMTVPHFLPRLRRAIDPWIPDHFHNVSHQWTGCSGGNAMRARMSARFTPVSDASVCASRSLRACTESKYGFAAPQALT